eukprot:1146667-Pelagomonas_calceolata.AAC.6
MDAQVGENMRKCIWRVVTRDGAPHAYAFCSFYTRALPIFEIQLDPRRHLVKPNLCFHEGLYQLCRQSGYSNAKDIQTA